MTVKAILHKATRAAPVQVSDRTVTGIAAVFGNMDDGNDVIAFGAFRKTLSERRDRIRHLWQHQTNEPPIARITELREIGRDELPPDLLARYPGATGGLLVTREYLDTPRGNEVLAGIKSGAITEMSIGFDIPKGKSDIQGRVRFLREIRLWETSDVIWGMNPATRAMKGLTKMDITQEDMAALQRAIEIMTAMLQSIGEQPEAEPPAELEEEAADDPIAAEPDETQAATDGEDDDTMKRLKLRLELAKRK